MGSVRPFFAATQFHPEFLSRPNRAYPVFAGLIGARARAEKRNKHRPRRIDTRFPDRGDGVTLFAGENNRNSEPDGVIELCTFGGVCVTVRAAQGDVLRVAERFPTRKAGELLAFLALARERPASRDAVADALWHDADSAVARGRLKQTVSLIRRALRPFDPFDAAAPRASIALAPRVQTDVDRWEAGQKRGDRSALRELWAKGAFLPDCDLPWALSARARYAVPPDSAPPTPSSPTADAVRLLATLREAGIVLPGEPGPLLLNALSGVSDALSAPERERLRRQHAARQQHVAARAQDAWHTPDASRILRSLDENRDDLAAAVRYLCDAKPCDALALAANLHYFWYVRGHIQTGRELTETALCASDERGTQARADALLSAGHFANCDGDNRAAFVRYREARAVYA
ncbi:MAG: hypothetical protein H7Y38_16525, partial [Armatimonadetes bacterium]|nr:hypothetical protein [Armatimonadota bacterium]